MITEQAIEELRRKLQEAELAVESALLLRLKAKENLHAALLEKCGLMGRRIKCKDGIMQIEDAEFTSYAQNEPLWLKGVYLKKDGSVGTRHASCRYIPENLLEEATDLP